MQSITVYQHRDGAIRVVAGEHTAHAGSAAARVAVYPDANLAYAAESDATVRAAIARIAPDVDVSAVTSLERVPFHFTDGKPHVCQPWCPINHVVRPIGQPFVPDAEIENQVATAFSFDDDRVQS
jgi:hypothetical protein